MNWRERIEVDPQRLCGKPVIKGTRISVGMILDFLASGWTAFEVANQYPNVQVEDVTACLRCGAALALAARALPEDSDPFDGGEWTDSLADQPRV